MVNTGRTAMKPSRRLKLSLYIRSSHVEVKLQSMSGTTQQSKLTICTGIELSSCGVLKTGLAYDRLFTFAQLDTKTDASTDTSKWRFITQREYPRLALLATELWVPDSRIVKAVRRDSILPAVEKVRGRREIVDDVDDWSANGGCLIVSFPYTTRSWYDSKTETVVIKLPISPTAERRREKCYSNESLNVWRDSTVSINMTSEIDSVALRKLECFLGVNGPLGLFRSDDDHLRQITRSLPSDKGADDFRVGFADAFPVHILNLASAQAVDDLMPGGVQSKGKLDAARFRANIYVSGPPAYAEDSWKRVAIGRTTTHKEPAEYHAACRTARCNLPNVDPKTGVRDRNEPGTTLRKHRQVDEGAKPHPTLGLSMIPLFEKGVISVGDEVEVLETGLHVYEKMFA